jgi:uncharacterized damage-inducible protein DinB
MKPGKESIRMNAGDFRLLCEYNCWADHHRILDACSSRSDGQFTRDLGSSFRSVRDTVVHICLVEWLWLTRWHGRWHSTHPPATGFPNLESVRRRWADSERNLLNYVTSLAPDDIHRIIDHTTTKGVPLEAPLWQRLQRVVNHGTYRRG